jgi:gamma-glutamyltranspeptidase
MLNTPRSLRGMVTSPHHLASQAGLDILRDGGTAIEASVAMAATLAVVYPHMTGIGGDSFWLTAEPGQPVQAIDACGASASACDLDLYAKAGLAAVPQRGPLAANTVAGAISGWAAALETSASQASPLPLTRLLAEAIRHAEDGVVVTAGGAAMSAEKHAELKDVSGYAPAFLNDGAPLREGHILKQPALALTLRRLTEAGLDDFYRGRIADDIAADLAAAEARSPPPTSPPTGPAAPPPCRPGSDRRPSSTPRPRPRARRPC